MQIRIAAAKKASKAAAKLGIKATVDDTCNGILLAALVCGVMPLGISQLALAILGMLIYALPQVTKPPTKRPPRSVCQKEPCIVTAPWRPCVPHNASPQQAPKHRSRPVREVVRQPKPETLHPSSVPVLAPTFHGVGFDAEVEELLGQIAPNPQSDRVVQQLARVVQDALRRVIPEIEVVGFASANLTRGTAFGVAVPEVDLVANVSPAALAKRFQQRFQQKGDDCAGKVDTRRLQKSALRICTDHLVSVTGVKFRRSAFSSDDPKVTLLAPTSLGVFDEAIPADFSVNSATPLHSAALLTECKQIDPRAGALILLVRRWAKDRAISHAVKGFLSPYAWSLLAIFFLQVGVVDEGPLLPPLEGFKVSSGLMARRPAITTLGCDSQAQSRKWNPPASGIPKKSAAILFKEFFHFYSAEIDWSCEAVSVRLGRRAPADISLPIKITLHDDGRKSVVGPIVQDPFETTRNLSAGMHETSFARFQEELRRADALCSREASLTQLLEPWSPPMCELARRGGVNDNVTGDTSVETCTPPSSPSLSHLATPTETPPSTPAQTSPRDTPTLASQHCDSLSPQSVAPSKLPPWRARGRRVR